MFKDRAKAKINLTLDVLGKRADGYHDLHSLVTFADIGDELSFTPSAQNEFTLTQQGFVVEGDNIILKAARLFKAQHPQTPYGAFHLIKNLPIASGIGGGSSDAACALRLLTKALGKQVDVSEIAKNLGADVSVCLTQKTRFMRGIGHDLSEEITHDNLHFLLINPLQGVSTKEIFTRLNAPLLNSQSHNASETKSFAMTLKNGKNDLQATAIALLPVIGEMLQALKNTKPSVARMSGSGATCFALYDTHEKAFNAAASLRQRYPNFWIACG